MLKAEVRRSFIATTVRDQSPRSHHKGTTSLVRTGYQRYPALCHCQLGQHIPQRSGLYHRSSLVRRPRPLPGPSHTAVSGALSAKFPSEAPSIAGPRSRAAVSVGLHPLCRPAPASGPLSPSSSSESLVRVCQCRPAAAQVSVDGPGSGSRWGIKKKFWRSENTVTAISFILGSA